MSNVFWGIFRDFGPGGGQMTSNHDHSVYGAAALRRGVFAGVATVAIAAALAMRATQEATAADCAGSPTNSLTGAGAGRAKCECERYDLRR